MILPNKFMQARYGKGLRKLLSDAKAVWKVVNFEDAQVFEEATTYTCLLFLQKAPSPKVLYIPAGDYLKEHADRPNLTDVEPLAFPAEPRRLTAAPWVFVSKREGELMDRLAAAGPTLGEITKHLFQGIRTSANDVYVLDSTGAEPHDGIVELYSQSLEKVVPLETDLLKPFLRGEEIKRYSITTPKRYVLIPYQIADDEAELVPRKVFEEYYPHCWRYLLANRQALEDRERGRMRHEHWYAYIYPKNLNLFGKSKIITPDIAASSSFALDKDGEYSFVSGYGIVLRDEVNYRLEYILGLLNSKVLDFYLKRVSTPLRGGFYRYFSQFLAQLPIRRIDFDNPEEKKTHDDLVALVERMLELNKRLERTVGREREELERRIEGTDGEMCIGCMG